MNEWKKYPVIIALKEQADTHGMDVEARETGDGLLHWRGLPNTGFAFWRGCGPRNHDPVAEQIQEAAQWWYENVKKLQ